QFNICQRAQNAALSEIQSVSKSRTPCVVKQSVNLEALTPAKEIRIVEGKFHGRRWTSAKLDAKTYDVACDYDQVDRIGIPDRGDNDAAVEDKIKIPEKALVIGKEEGIKQFPFAHK